MTTATKSTTIILYECGESVNKLIHREDRRRVGEAKRFRLNRNEFEILIFG